MDRQSGGTLSAQIGFTALWGGSYGTAHRNGHSCHRRRISLAASGGSGKGK